MAESLLIVGASVRAAAFSALRAGFAPLAIDMFGDQDLIRRVPTIRATSFPAGLPAAARQMPDAPLMYTGACENHPMVLDALQRTRRLYGNPSSVLQAVRDPVRVSTVLAAAGCTVPRIDDGTAELESGATWLRKPLRGSAGFGIVHRTRQPTSPETANGVYFQQWIDGTPCAAVFVAAAGTAILLGVTQQIIGEPWTGADGFRYAGSLGPLTLDRGLYEAWSRIGSTLSANFYLEGLFGVDAIVQDGKVWPVEVNPRYPASTEVLERSLGIHAIQYHVDACRGNRLPQTAPTRALRRCGKAILYAQREVTISERIAKLLDKRSGAREWPPLADVPVAGTHIPQNRPVATILVHGNDLQSVKEQLRLRVRELEEILYTDTLPVMLSGGA